MMQARQTIIDLFSTFLLLEPDRANGWAIDPQLRRSMKTCSEQFQDQRTSEQFWEVYWHKRWLASRPAEGKSEQSPSADRAAKLAESHLSAYLQESCYWAAHKTLSRMVNSPCQLSDCFQMAILAVPKILKACDPDQQARLKTYSSVAFGNVIRDALRQRQEGSFCNDWALLLRISRKRLQEALQAAGLSTDRAAYYVLAWSCFEEVYLLSKPSGAQRIKRPEAAMWAAIEQRYNQQRTDDQPIGRAASLETWLLDCAKQVRTYLFPSVASLNTPTFEDSGDDWQTNLSGSEASPLTQLIAQEELDERRLQQQQLSDVLTTALKQLDPASATLLQLYYQQGLTQQQMAKQLNMQQYTVSRRLSKTREQLLLALGRWSQETLHIAPTSTVMNSISSILEEWLQGYYSRPDNSEIPL